MKEIKGFEVNPDFYKDFMKFKVRSSESVPYGEIHCWDSKGNLQIMKISEPTKLERKCMEVAISESAVSVKNKDFEIRISENELGIIVDAYSSDEELISTQTYWKED
jgi:hypothetical protein